jgi:uncharacterized protein YndB with AHSA1/START domain
MLEGPQNRINPFIERKNTMNTDTGTDREIVITRVINAPRERVFDVWLDPENKTHWWGPRGFRTTTYEANPVVGGYWRFTMHGPDGTDYENLVQYVEIERPARLKYIHGIDHENPDDFHAEITFEEEGGKTKVTLRLDCHTAEACAAKKKFGAIEGGNQTLDRLEAFLAQEKG